jgi:hypothetical protein
MHDSKKELTEKQAFPMTAGQEYGFYASVCTLVCMFGDRDSTINRGHSQLAAKSREGKTRALPGADVVPAVCFHF